MDNNRILIREAHQSAKDRGINTRQNETAKFAFPGISDHSSVVRLGNYTSGRSTKIDRKQVIALSVMYDTDPNQLFGWDEYQKNLRESEENP